MKYLFHKFSKTLAVIILPLAIMVNSAFAQVNLGGDNLDWRVDIRKSKQKIANNPPEVIINKVEQYLNDITTFKADFVQTAPDGTKSTGKFFLSRPGKLRWQYNPPVPVLIVANGSTITYYDYELEETSNVPSDETFADFLTQKKISFAEGIKILHIEEKNDQIRLVVTQENKEEEGALALIFDSKEPDASNQNSAFLKNSDKNVENNIRLVGMQVADNTAQQTSILFQDIQQDIPLDGDRLFRIPRKSIFKR